MLSSEIPARLKRAAGDSRLGGILGIVETTSPQSGEFALPLSSVPERPSGVPSQTDHLPDIPRSLLDELWLSAKGELSGLTLDEFGTVLYSVSTKFNYGFPAATYPDASQKADFLRSLRLEDLALATACALGREIAWQRFLRLYRAPLTQAAVAMTGSATLGHELADSLYSEIYGLREVDGERRSPLASYSGRGSLLGWLRTTLAQRHVDHHRRTHRETSLDTLDAPAPQPGHSPAPAELARLTHAVARTLQELAAEDRYLLSTYFLDRRPLAQIARVLYVHEATVSRRLKRLLADLRKQLLRNLQSDGLNMRAAEEALGNDPRDIEINLRTLLQSSQTSAFSEKTAPNARVASGHL
jgi:RNA polymerase sigma-70 factor (ECF subfamily)